MFAADYKDYFLRTCSDEECDAPFSPVVKISATKDHKPIATVYISEPCRTKQDAIQLGFETGMEWVDKTLPLLARRKTAAQTSMDRSREIARELQFLIAKTTLTVERSLQLIYRSRQPNCSPILSQIDCASASAAAFPARRHQPRAN